MKNKILALCFIILLTTVCLTTTLSFTQAAGEGQWITAYTIEDATTGQQLAVFDAAAFTNQSSPILPNTEIKVTFTINVFAAGADTMRLTTSLSKSTTHANGYWELQTDSYDLGSSYNPNSASTSFKWTLGTFDMVLYGKVPALATSANSKSVNIVTLTSGSSGTPIDQITIQVTSSGLANFNAVYNKHEGTLHSLISNGVDQGYITIYTKVLNASKTIANAGDPNNAIALLNSLDQATPPAGSTMQGLFLPAIGITAAIAVVFLVLFLRTRGKLSYFNLVVEDQIKDLEGLTLRASKIDRAMSANLDSVKDRLKRLVGM
jgi:hypothetical protein